MSARYVVRAVPYGLTHNPDLNARFAVVDTAPEIETFETPAGVVTAEERAPPWRTVAWCQKENHAVAVAASLNLAVVVREAAEASCYPKQLHFVLGETDPEDILYDLTDSAIHNAMVD